MQPNQQVQANQAQGRSYLKMFIFSMINPGLQASFWMYCAWTAETLSKDWSRAGLEQPRYWDKWNQEYDFAVAPVSQEYINGTWVQTGGLGMNASTTDPDNYANGGAAKDNIDFNITNTLVPTLTFTEVMIILAIVAFIYRYGLQFAGQLINAINLKEPKTAAELQVAAILRDRALAQVEQVDEANLNDLRVAIAPAELLPLISGYEDQTIDMQLDQKLEVRNTLIYKHLTGTRSRDEFWNQVKMAFFIGSLFYMIPSKMINTLLNSDFYNTYNDWRSTDLTTLVNGGGCYGDMRHQDCENTASFNGNADALNAQMSASNNDTAKVVLGTAVCLMAAVLAVAVVHYGIECVKRPATQANDGADDVEAEHDVEDGNGLLDPLVEPQQAPGQAGFFGGMCARMAEQIQAWRGYAPVNGNGGD